MSIEERVLRLEELVQSLAQLAIKSDHRQDGSDDRLDKLTDLAVRFDERIDALAAAQENSERKLAALTDAQIRTEEALTETTERLNSLIVLVERYIGGRDGAS